MTQNDETLEFTPENTAIAPFEPASAVMSQPAPEKAMPLDISVPKQQPVVLLDPKITVIGVGGGGGNAINNMVDSQLEGITFIACNTDAQALNVSKADIKIQIGIETTKGQGSGARPEVGKESAEEALDEIERALEDTNMLFITAGMGGGTGTGAAPVIAKLAQEKGILTVGVVTKPFDFEGKRRKQIAEQGIEELSQYVDTLIVIKNQNLFIEATEKTTFAEAFKRADQVLQEGVRSITDLILIPGILNLDFADIRTIMSEMGRAMMGTGQASGENRAQKAAEAAISNPLLENTSLMGSKGILINISGGADLALFEVDEAVGIIREQVDPDANIIFGAALDNALEGFIRVSIVATGIPAPEDEAKSPLVDQTNVAFPTGFSRPKPAAQNADYALLRKSPEAPRAVKEPEIAPQEQIEQPAHASSYAEPSYKEPAYPSAPVRPFAPTPSSAIPSMPSAKDLFAGISSAPAKSEPEEPMSAFDFSVPKGPLFAHAETAMQDDLASFDAPEEKPQADLSAPQQDLFPDLPAPVIPEAAKTAEHEHPRATLWQRVTAFSRGDSRDEKSAESEDEAAPEESDNLDIPAFLRR